jgi:hypothetical protein
MLLLCVTFSRFLLMQVSRQDLIQICDKFLQDEIGRQEVEDYAWALITSDNHERDDEIIAETLVDWDNEEMNFPINKVNMQLWKKRLITGVDELSEHNIWNVHIDKQKDVCERFGSNWTPINNKFILGASENLTADPIHGLRHPYDRETTKGTTGWFIWTGDYSEADDFFKPMCAEHLLQIRPQIIKYLGLDIGFRFIADNSGYEDVWHDETLKQVD